MNDRFALTCSSPLRACVVVLAFSMWGSSVFCQPANTTPSVPSTNAPSKFRSDEDGWLDVSGFLDEKYGFLPMVVPITEPAVGYGAAVGLAFISSPLGEAREG